MRTFPLLLAVVLVGCAQSGVTEKPDRTATGTTTNANQQLPGSSGFVEPQSLVVRLCEGIDAGRVDNVMAHHSLVIKSRASSTVLELEWRDRRSVEEVMEELELEGSVFCHVQPNYRYRAF